MNKSAIKSAATNFYSKISQSLLKFGQKNYLMAVLGIFIVGFCMAAFMTLDKNWWKDSTCSLGMKVNGTPEFYNYTFVVVGVLLLIFAISLKPQIKLLIENKILTNMKARVLKIFYFVEMISIILVGAIRYGDSQPTNVIHVWLGFYVFINVGIAMFFAFWLFSKFSKKFIITSYILLAVGSLSYFLGIQAKMLPYAVSEILTIICVIIWLGMVLTKIESLSKLKHTAKVL